jgi:pantothenate kinase
VRGEIVELAGLADLLQRIEGLSGDRILIALAGPPGAGKSTLAKVMVDALNARSSGAADVVPMDGFHYDDAVLSDWGLLAKKGAPQTFDVGGLSSLLERLRTNVEKTIAVPVFDRNSELSRASARIIPAHVRILVVEGNYLLLNMPPWSCLRPFFDLTVMLTEDLALLRHRLISRWLSYGFDAAGATAKAVGNDLPNVDLVLKNSAPADVEITSSKSNKG